MKPTVALTTSWGVAERLRQSYNAQPIGPFRTAFPATIADAYAIQQANTAWWTLNGRTRVGAKISLTARAVAKATASISRISGALCPMAVAGWR